MKQPLIIDGSNVLPRHIAVARNERVSGTTDPGRYSVNSEFRSLCAVNSLWRAVDLLLWFVNLLLTVQSFKYAANLIMLHSYVQTSRPLNRSSNMPGLPRFFYWFQMIETDCFTDLNIYYKPDGTLVDDLNEYLPPPPPNRGFFARLFKKKRGNSRDDVNAFFYRRSLFGVKVFYSSFISTWSAKMECSATY